MWNSNFKYLNSTVANLVSYPIIDDSNERPGPWYAGTDDYSHLLDYPLNTTGPGGYTIFMQLWWPSLYAGNPEILAYIDQGSGALTAVLNCNFTYYNVTMHVERGENYTVVDEVISERFLSDGFSGPLRSDALTSAFIDNIPPIILYPRTQDEERMDYISLAFSEIVMKSASIFANMTEPAIDLQQTMFLNFGRYPIIPVVLLVSVLFLNSLFALVICVATSFSRTDSIRVPGKIGSKSVPLLDLARIRLVSPAALVADRFPLKDPVNLRRVEIQAKQDTLDMFCEDAVERRVRIGMHKDKESGESVFGTWIEDSDEI